MAGIFDEINDLPGVQNLVTACVRESEVLEYKTAAKCFTDSEKGEIAKDVSAMANSGGGLIVYGVATDALDKTKPVAIQPIEVRNIETFDRVFNSQVKPPIRGVRKKVIPTTAPQIMLVDIPESENPPHQSLYDKKYYRRSGAESLPMEHDLVALYFGRRTGPLLGVQFHPLAKPSGFSGDPSFSNPFTVRVQIVNEGKRIGQYVEAIFIFPHSAHVRIPLKSGYWESIDSLYPGFQVRQYTNNIGVFHPKMSKSILEIDLSVSKEYFDQKLDETFVQCTVYANEMDPRGGNITLRQLMDAAKTG
jgi:hypothetical protein